jgi:hypothetical protein
VNAKKIVHLFLHDDKCTYDVYVRAIPRVSKIHVSTSHIFNKHEVWGFLRKDSVAIKRSHS